MTVWRGGRGVKAPYETTHVRIPVDIKDRVEELSRAYKEGRLEEVSLPVDLDKAVELARGVLKKKKSARVSMESLLTAMYGEEVNL
jgi:hypothetical protein